MPVVHEDMHQTQDQRQFNSNRITLAANTLLPRQPSDPYGNLSSNMNSNMNSNTNILHGHYTMNGNSNGFFSEPNSTQGKSNT